MRTYKCFECDYITTDPYKICLQGDGFTELCANHCGCHGQ